MFLSLWKKARLLNMFWSHPRFCPNYVLRAVKFSSKQIRRYNDAVAGEIAIIKEGQLLFQDKGTCEGLTPWQLALADPSGHGLCRIKHNR